MFAYQEDDEFDSVEDGENQGEIHAVATSDSDTVTSTPVQHSDWFQTMVTVPLLAASAGAVYLMLPVNAATQPAAGASAAVAAGFGFDGHDHAARREHVVMARMESERARLRSQSGE